MGVPWRGLTARVVLPLVLLISAVVRINVISMSYLLAFMLLVTSPNFLEKGLWRYRERTIGIITALCIISGGACLANTVIQIAAAAGHSLITSKSADWWAGVGFHDLSKEEHWARVVRLIGADFAIAVICFFSQLVVRKATPPGDSSSDIWNGLLSRNLSILFRSDFVVLPLLYAVGLSQPGVISAVYVLMITGISVLWAVGYKSTLQGRVFRKSFTLFAGAHMIALYLYQFRFLQKALTGVDGLGLVAFIVGNNNQDAIIFEAVGDGVQFVYAVSLVLTFVILGEDLRVKHTQNVRPAAQVDASSTYEDSNQESLLLPVSGATTTESTTDPEEESDNSPRPIFGMVVSWLQDVKTFALANVYVLSLVLLVLWSVVYPTWPAFILLLWTEALLVLPVRYFDYTAKPLLGYVGLVFLTNYFGAVVGTFEYRNLSEWAIDPYSRPRVLFGNLCVTTAMFWSIIFSVRKLNDIKESRETRESKNTLTVSGSNEIQDTASEIGDISLGSKENDGNTPKSNLSLSILSKLGAVGKGIGIFAVSGTYLVAVLVIFIAMLDSISAVNAVYLLLITVFLAFPVSIRRGWIVLVVYCEIAIATKYLWSFNELQDITSESTDKSVLGVGRDDKGVFYDVRWDLVVLALALIQFYAIRRFPKMTPMLSSVNGKIVRRFWQFVVPITFVVAGLVGNVTLFKVGYLLVVFIAEAFRQMDLRILSDQCWSFGLLYTGAVLFIMYVYQFEEVQDHLDGQFAGFNTSQIGLEAETSQRGRAEYLAFPFVVLCLSMLRARIATSKAKKGPAFERIVINSAFDTDVQNTTFSARLNHSITRGMQIGEKILMFFFRFYWLESDKLIILLAFATAVLNPPVALGFVTVVLVVCALLYSGSWREVLFGLILIWFEAVIIMRMVSKLARTVKTDSETLAWVGIGTQFDLPGDEEVMHLLCILSIAFRKRLRSKEIEQWLWPTIPNVVDRSLLNIGDPKDGVQSYSSYALSVFNRVFETYGAEFCVAMAAITAFVRLNVIGLSYLGLAPFLASKRVSKLRIAFIFIAVAVTLQVLVVIGFPPRYTIPWEEWSIRNSTKREKALMRWAYVPPVLPIESDDPYDESNIINYGPISWMKPFSLFADMVLLLLVSMQVYQRSSRSHRSSSVTTSRAVSARSERGTNNEVKSLLAQSESVHVGWASAALQFLFEMVVLWLVVLAALSRRDIMCLGYLYIIARIAWIGGTMQEKKQASAWWKSLRRFNYVVLLIHLIWVLPAVVFFGRDEFPNRSLIPGVLALFGLRRGHSVVLYPTDDRISVWEPRGNGQLWDIVLFAVLQFHKKLLNSQLFQKAFQKFRADSTAANGRVDEFYATQRKLVNDRLIKHERQANHVRQVMDSLKERTSSQTFSKRVNDQATIKEFSNISLSTKTSNIDLSSVAELLVTDSANAKQSSRSEIENDAALSATQETVTISEMTDGASANSVHVDNDEIQKDNAIDSNKEDMPAVEVSASKTGIYEKVASVFLTLTNWMMKDTYLYRILAKGQVSRTVEKKEFKSWNFFAAIGWYCATRTHILCYLGGVLAVASSANLLGIIYAVLIFCWGLLQPGLYPSPRFFRALGLYACFNIVCRYLFRLIAKALLQSIDDTQSVSSNYKETTDVLGLTLPDDCSTFGTPEQCLAGAQGYMIPCSWDSARLACNQKFGFQLDLLPDVFLLLTILLHRFVQTRFGLWSTTVKKIVNENRLTTTSSNVEDSDEDSLGCEIVDDSDVSQDRSSESAGKTEKKSFVVKVKSLFKSLRSSIFSVLNSALQDAENDYYTATFIIQFIALVTIVFGYKSFSEKEDDNVADAVNSIASNKIPTSFLIYLIFQLLIIIVDRVLFLLRAIRAKLLFHVVLVIIVHSIVFFYIPNVTGTSFQRNTILVVWYIELAIYLYLSAVQIRSGYPSDVLKNITYKTDISAKTVTRTELQAQIYFNVPFLYEARSILDWSCSTTTLTMMEWLKLEDIAKQLFFVNIAIIGRTVANRKFGEAQPKKKKAVGAVIFAFLILVLLFPLLAMSFVGSQSVPNPPQTVDVSLQLFTFEPLYVQGNYPAPINISYFDVITRNATGGMKDATIDDIDISTFGSDSQQIWGISPTSFASLKYNLERFYNESRTAPLKFSWRFRRTEISGGLSTVEAEGSSELTLKGDQLLILLAMLEGTDVGPGLLLEGLFPSYVYLGPVISTAAYRSSLPAGFITDHRANCFLKFYQNGPDAEQKWWSLTQVPSSSLNWCPGLSAFVPGCDENRSEGPQLVSFSARVAPPELSFLASYGLVALYVTGVLAVGRFLRMAFNDVSHKIPYEDMPQVKTLQNLCYLIRLARARRPEPDLELEERLFRLLVSIYRSTEAMGLWTQIRTASTKQD